MAILKPKKMTLEEGLACYFTNNRIEMDWRAHINYITEEEKRRYPGKFLRHDDGTIEVL